jgi:hypothetical protein
MMVIGMVQSKDGVLCAELLVISWRLVAVLHFCLLICDLCDEMVNHVRVAVAFIYMTDLILDMALYTTQRSSTYNYQLK